MKEQETLTNEEVKTVMDKLNSMAEEEMEYYRNTPEWKRFLQIMLKEAFPQRNNSEQKKQEQIVTKELR